MDKATVAMQERVSFAAVKSAGARGCRYRVVVVLEDRVSAFGAVANGVGLVLQEGAGRVSVVPAANEGWENVS